MSKNATKVSKAAKASKGAKVEGVVVEAWYTRVKNYMVEAYATAKGKIVDFGAWFRYTLAKAVTTFGLLGMGASDFLTQSGWTLLELAGLLLKVLSLPFVAVGMAIDTQMVAEIFTQAKVKLVPAAA